MVYKFSAMISSNEKAKTVISHSEIYLSVKDINFSFLQFSALFISSRSGKKRKWRWQMSGVGRTWHVDMGSFWTVSQGVHECPHHNFVVITPMIKKFGTGIKLDVFYIMVTKLFVTSQLLGNFDVIICILANA